MFFDFCEGGLSNIYGRLGGGGRATIESGREKFMNNIIESFMYSGNWKTWIILQLLNLQIFNLTFFFL